MNFKKEIKTSLDRIHANHQLRLITTRISEEIESIKSEQGEIKERLLELEKKGGENNGKTKSA